MIGHYVKFWPLSNGVSNIKILPKWVNFLGFILICFGYKKIKYVKLPHLK